MDMEMMDVDDYDIQGQTMFCPHCHLQLYQKDECNKFFLFVCRACGHEEQLDYEFSWQTHKVNKIPILPCVKLQKGGTCIPNALVTSLESRLKFLHAKDKLEFVEDLSVDDMVKQYEEEMGPSIDWKNGKECEERIDKCKEILEVNGVLTTKAFASKDQQSRRYKARASRKLKSSFLASCKRILRGNVLFTTVPVTKQFKKLKGEEIYIADLSRALLDKDQFKQHHGIVLVGFGRRNNVNFFKFMNSHGTNFGNKGFSYVRAQEIQDITQLNPC